MKASELLKRLEYIVNNLGDAEVYSSRGIFIVDDVEIVLSIENAINNLGREKVSKILIKTQE